MRVKALFVGQYRKIFWIGLGFWFLLLRAGGAQDIGFYAEVDRKSVGLGSTIQLTFTLEGTQEIVSLPLTEIDNFDIRYLGPTTRVSIVNGRYSSSKSFVYSLFPLKTGRLTIPSVAIHVSGKTYTTDPLEIEVTDTSARLPAGTAPAPSPAQPETSRLEDKIFLVLEVPQKEIYLYQKVPVRVILYVTDLTVTDIHFPELKQIGIDVGKLGRPKQYQQIMQGVRYQVVEFNMAVYPTRTGDLTLGPVNLECNIIVRTSSRGSPGVRGPSSIFDDDFFDAFFDRQEKRPVTLRSQEAVLHVLPLPEEGKPQNFSGAVGQFNFDVSASPLEVNAGDPITLRMNVHGDGNLKAVQLPALSSLQGFKIYDPQVKEEEQAKTLEQVVIPNSSEIKDIPAIEFFYFDPGLKKYQTISRGPFPIRVRKAEDREGLKIVGGEKQLDIVEPEVVGQDIIFIKDSPGTFYLMGRHVCHDSRFYTVIVIGVGVWIALYAFYQRTHKMETDVVYARRLLAPKEAGKGLRQAARLKALNQKGEFYTALFKTLQQYLGNKLHLSSGAVTFATVQPRLSGCIEPAVLEELKHIFEECDAVRYAPAALDETAMSGSYERVQKIIDYLERHLR